MEKIISFSLFLTVLANVYRCNELAVYWGQDPAGVYKLLLEKKLDYYCLNYAYDIIPIAFLDIFFDMNNKGDLPGINLANHCNTSFPGYPDLLNCTDIAKQIQTCQRYGRKIILSLGGAAGLYGFSSAKKAEDFALVIWNLFLGGNSPVKPFPGVALDGVDLDIEGGSSKYYGSFIIRLRSFTDSDMNKRYIITGAPQCPYPDVIMGPGTNGTVLYDIPQEFDHLFVQFYNNYCYLGAQEQFNGSLSKWIQFAKSTKSKYGKGPTIFIGLPAHPKASTNPRYYQTPTQVQEVYEKLRDNPNIGGIMLWDASFDLNNVFEGKHYSGHIAKFLNKPPTFVICGTPEETEEDIDKDIRWIGWIITIIAFVTFLAMGVLMYRIRKSKQNSFQYEIADVAI